MVCESECGQSLKAFRPFGKGPRYEASLACKLARKDRQGWGAADAADSANSMMGSCCSSIQKVGRGKTEEGWGGCS